MKPSHHYQKRILLAVSGMSPQIVTETLYSLATREKAPFIPTDIFLITTANGKKQAEQQLLHPDTGKFHQLCTDYALPDINFPADNILVIKDAAGELDDIKTPENNEAAADFIIRKVRDLAQDSETALHASIAGGRKTMGYYLGYALSLYGRSQDILSHVLVTDKFENLKDFFYPTLYSNIIYDREQRSLDTQEAEVMLAEIPFVRLTDGSVPPFLQNEKVGFSDSVRMVQALEDEPLLQIDVNANKDSRFLVSNLAIEVPMNDVDFVFYLWVIQRSHDGQPIERNQLPKRPPKSNKSPIKGNQVYAQEFLEVYERNLHELKDSDRTEEGLTNGMYQQFLNDRLSAINKAFNGVLGTRAAKPYLIHDINKRNGCKEYKITLSEEYIRFL